MAYLSTLSTVFKTPLYLIGAVLVAWIVFTLSIWIPNLPLITTIATSSTVPLTQKFHLLWSLYGSIGTNFTKVSAAYTIAIAVLFGIQSMLLLFYVRQVRGGVRSIATSGATSIGGLISGIFGIGCAACGTFILTSALTLVGAGGMLALLPFGGEEFGFIAVGILLYAIYALLKKIQSPKVCATPDAS